MAAKTTIAVLARPWPATGRRVPTPAFTLIEVLVALALVSTIAAIVYGSFTATCRAVDLYHCRLACSARTSRVLRLMARQIRCAYLPPAAGVPQPHPGSTPALGGDPSIPPPEAAKLLPQPGTAVPQGTLSPPSAAFRAEAHPIGSTAVSFVTTGGPGADPDQPTPPVRVSYRHDPAQGILSLAWEPYVPGAAAGPPPGHAILTGVQRLDVQLFDGRTWQPRWDAGNGATLPQAVKIALTVVDDRARVHEFRTQVAVVGRRPPHRPPVAAGERL